MYRLLFFLVLIMGICSACQKPCKEADSVDIAMNLYLQDSLGRNLLDPATPGGTKVEYIRLYHLKNSNAELVYQPGYDCPSNVCAFQGAKGPGITLFPYATDEALYPVTLVAWGNGPSDFIKCHFFRKQGECSKIIQLDSIWFNNVLKFPSAAPLTEGRTLTLTLKSS